MKFINKYLRNLSPYRVASHKIWEVGSNERSRILKLDWNEATIAPSPLVQKALLELVSEPETFALYPSTHNKKLIELLASYSGLPSSYVQYFASSDALHEYLVRMYVSVGDPVLIVSPTYDNFRLTCESQGAKLYFFQLGQNFVLDEADLHTTIGEVRPSLIYLCSPNNPTGNEFGVGFIEELVSKYSDSIFLIDEAYYEFSGSSAKDLAMRYENIFISRTFSKAFALANFRAGYLLSSPENVEQISKIRNAKNFTTFAQVAVIAALSDLDYMHAYVKEVTLARNEFVRFLGGFPNLLTCYPSRANFILIRFLRDGLKEAVIEHLEGNNIFVRNLTHSAALLNCVRITVGTISQMKRVESVLEETLAKKH